MGRGVRNAPVEKTVQAELAAACMPRRWPATSFANATKERSRSGFERLDHHQHLAILDRLAVVHQNLADAPGGGRFDLVQHIERFDGPDDLPLFDAITRCEGLRATSGNCAVEADQRRADVEGLHSIRFSLGGVWGGYRSVLQQLFSAQ